MDEWRKKGKKKMKGRREISEFDVGQARSASEARWRKRKNLSARHEEWRSEK